MEYLFIYLMECCDMLRAFALVTPIIVIFLIGMVVIPFNLITYNEVKINKLKKPIIISTIVLLISALIPSKNTLILMGGVYLGKSVSKQVVQSEKWQKLNKIIDLEMDHYLEDIEKAYQNKQQQRH